MSYMHHIRFFFASTPGYFNKIVAVGDTIIPNYFYSLNVPDACGFDTVRGRVYIDQNANCNYESANGVVINSFFPNFTYDYTNTPFAYPYGSNMNTNGQYTKIVQKSWLNSYTVSVPVQYQFAFKPTTCTILSHTYTSLPQNNVGFSFQCDSLDAKVLGVNNYARPGYPFTLFSGVYNFGCTPVSGILKMVLDPNVSYNAANSLNPADSISGDTLMWHYSNLNNLDDDTLYFDQFIGGIELTPNTLVEAGDLLTFKLISDVPTGDVNPANNEKIINIYIVNSYDPNIKEVEPKGTVIKNKASIYFDYNPPIITNFAKNKNEENLHLNKNKLNQIKVYPNPASDIVNFKLPSKSSGEIQIHSITGRKVVAMKFVKKSMLSIATNKLSKGMYIYSISSANGEITNGKLILK